MSDVGLVEVVADAVVIVEVKLEEEAADVDSVLELAAEVETVPVDETTVVKLAKLVEIELVDWELTVLVDNVLAVVMTVVGLVDVEGVVVVLDRLVGNVLVIVEVMLEVEPADVDAVFELVDKVELVSLDDNEVLGLVDTVPVVDVNGVVLAKLKIKNNNCNWV